MSGRCRKCSIYLKQAVRILSMWKKIVAAVVMTVVIVVSVYFTYFHHPPPEDILAANMAKRSHPKDIGCCCCNNCGRGNDDYDDEDSEEEELSPAKEAKKRWEKFIAKNNYVDVGTIYTKCEGDDRIVLGKVIMLPDPKNGGVMTRTFANVTLEKEITTGDVHVISEYNGKELYNSVWEVCTAEDGMDDKIIHCPIQPGKHSYVKDLPIPSYLPKGKFMSKAWVTDPDENMLGCSVSEFTI